MRVFSSILLSLPYLLLFLSKPSWSLTECGQTTKLSGEVDDDVIITHQSCTIELNTAITGGLTVDSVPIVLTDLNIGGDVLIYDGEYDDSVQQKQVDLIKVVISGDLLLPNGGSVYMDNGAIEGSVFSIGAKVSLNGDTEVKGNFKALPQRGVFSYSSVELFHVTVGGNIFFGKIDDGVISSSTVSGSVYLQSLSAAVQFVSIDGDLMLDAKTDAVVTFVDLKGNAMLRGQRVLMYETNWPKVAIGFHSDAKDSGVSTEVYIEYSKMGNVQLVDRAFLYLPESHIGKVTTSRYLNLQLSGSSIVDEVRCFKEGERHIELDLKGDDKLVCKN